MGKSIVARRLAVVSLVVLVVGIAIFATGATALAATTTNTGVVSATIPAGGWVAYTFYFPGPGSNVGVTMTYNGVPGVANLDKWITLDAYQPKDGYRDSIGSASMMSRGVQFYQLDSKSLTRSEKASDLIDAPAAAGTYMLIVHNWNPGGQAVTVNLSTSLITKQVEDFEHGVQRNNSRYDQGYFLFESAGAPALKWLSKGS